MLPAIARQFNYYRSPNAWYHKLGAKRAFRFATLCAELNEFLSPDALRKMRWPRLVRLLAHSYETVPLYRDRFTVCGITPGDLGAERDLWRLTPVTKSDFRHSGSEGYIARNLPRWRRKEGLTSGSTGEPFRYIRDLAYQFEQRALAQRVWNWAGVDVYGKKIHCSTTTGHVWPNMTSLHPHFIQAKKAEYIKTMRALGAELLYGYSLTVFELLWMLYQEGVRDVRFRTAVLTGHATAAGIRAFMRGRFNCEVFTYYAAAELGIIAIECGAHEGLHVQEENMIVEVVDENGRSVSDGTVGKIIVTSLTNDIMPFVRYDTGDLGAFLPRPCPCGRTLRRIVVEGRANEQLLAGPHGECICPGILRDVLDGRFDYFQRYQMIQDALNAFTLNVVPTERYTPDLDSALVEELRQAGGYPIEVTVRVVDAIPPLPNGKFQYFISNLWVKKFPPGLVVSTPLQNGAFPTHL